MKKNIKLIILSIMILLFIFLCILVKSKNDIFIDSLVYRFLSKIISNDITNIAKIFTFFGSALAVISITILLLIFLKNKKYSLFLSLDLVIITLFQLLLKNIFVRSRPININLIEETGYSFPSGHSLTALAFYGLIIYFIFNSNIDKKIKKILILLLSFLILLIGLSRIYLGVHYFTDVVGAFSFSTIYLIIFIKLIKKHI